MLTGRQTAGIVLTSLLATLVIPPTGAWLLNARRIEETVRRVDAGAAAVARGRVVNDMASGGPAIVCGDGRIPDISENTVRARSGDVDLSTHEAWLTAVRPAQQVPGASLQADAWGRCLLVRLQPTPALVVSAGPNGIIETLISATVPGGDDIAAVVR